MKAAAVLLAALTLASCRSGDMLEDKRVLCDLYGQAWIARAGVGDTSFVARLPDADHLCTCLRR